MVDVILPIELIECEILERLPLKSLLRFKCVCKEWYSIISNSKNFIYSHLKRSRKTGNNDVLLVPTLKSYIYYNEFDPHNISPSSSFLSFDLPLEFQPPDYYTIDGELTFSSKVVGTCNGLICISWYPNKNKLALCNPITRDFRTLPSLDPHPHDSTDRVGFGFGYNSNTDDYKVVKILNTAGSIELKEDGDDKQGVAEFLIMVYSMRTNSWKTMVVEIDLYPVGVRFVGDAFYINNTLYWYMRTRSSEQFLPITFHLPSEQLGTMCMADFCRELDLFNMRVLSESLCQGYTGHIVHYQALIMKEYDKVGFWTLLFATLYDLRKEDLLGKTPIPIAYYPRKNFVLLKDVYDDDLLHRYNFVNAYPPFEPLKFPMLPAISLPPVVFVGSLVNIPNCDATYGQDQQEGSSGKRSKIDVRIQRILNSPKQSRDQQDQPEVRHLAELELSEQSSDQPNQQEGSS